MFFTVSAAPPLTSYIKMVEVPLLNIPHPFWLIANLSFDICSYSMIFNLIVALDLRCHNCCCKVWLIFNLFIPFAEVLLHTYMDNLRYSFNYIPLPASYFPPTLENITYVYFQNLENTGYILQSSPPHFKWTIIYPSQRHIFLLL